MAARRQRPSRSLETSRRRRSLSGLVSLITLTQVFTWNRDGEGTEPVHTLDPVAADATATMAAIDQAVGSGQPEPLQMTIQPAQRPSEPVPSGS